MRRITQWSGALLLALAVAVAGVPLVGCDAIGSKVGKDKKDKGDDDDDDDKKKKKKKKKKKGDDDDDDDDASPSASAGGVALEVLPVDVDGVGVLDFSAVKESGVWKLGGELLAEAAKDNAELQDDLDEMDKNMAEFEEKAGFHPMKHLTAMTVGVRSVDSGDDAEFIIVIDGEKFSEEKIEKWMKEEGKDKDLKTEKVGKVNVHADDEFGFAFLGSERVLFGSTDLLFDAVDDLADEADSAKDNKELMAALERVDAESALHVAVPVGDAVANAIGLDDGDALPGLEKMTAMAFELDLKEGLHIAVKLGFDSADDAKEALGTLEGFAKMGESMAEKSAKDIPCGKDLAKLTDSYKLESDGDEVVFALGIPEAELEELVRCLMDAAKGFMPSDAFPDIPLIESSSSKIGDGASSSGGGGGCEAYKACMAAMGEAYLEADFPGAKAAAKALKDAAKSLKGLTGAAGESACNSGLDAMRKAADAYRSMPKFEFPDECK